MSEISRDIVVPKWGMTMEEATLVRWLKEVGDFVEVDEPVAEMETDKVTGEIFSPCAGVLAEILVSVGSEIVPGEVIAWVRE